MRRTKDILGAIAKWITIAAFAIGIARWTLDQQIKAVAAGYTPIQRTEAIESRLSDVSEMMGYYSAYWNAGPIAHGLWYQAGERKAVWESSIFNGTNEGGIRLVEVE